MFWFESFIDNRRLIFSVSYKTKVIVFAVPNKPSDYFLFSPLINNGNFVNVYIVDVYLFLSGKNPNCDKRTKVEVEEHKIDIFLTH